MAEGPDKSTGPVTAADPKVGASASLVESKEEVSLRRWVLLSFWVVLVVLGVPTWWQTTSVYQARLPTTTMLEWGAGKYLPTSIPVTIPIETDGPPTDEVRLLIAETQKSVDKRFESTYLSPVLEYSSTKAGESEFSVKIKLAADLEHGDSKFRFDESDGSLELLVGPIKGTEGVNSVAGALASKIHEAFGDEIHSLHSIVTDENAPHGDPVYDSRVQRLGQLSPQVSKMLSKRNTVAFKHSSTIHLTFSLFTASASPSSWEIRDALDLYLHPLLKALSGVASFTVDTQLQMHSRLSSTIRPPQFSAERGEWLLDKVDLTEFINSAEWPLGPSIGAGQTINFAVYIPEEAHQPLGINGTESKSWIVPQWGSVYILNTAGAGATHLSRPDIEGAMLTFTRDLLRLIGIGEGWGNLLVQLSAFRRVLAMRLVAKSSATLSSIVRLTESMATIAIPNSVAVSTEAAIRSLEQATAALRSGRIEEALEQAQIAHDQAEMAFFDPAMVTQAHFPDEHKVAVYLPLLGPVSAPLVLALVKEVKTSVFGREGG